MKEAAIKHLDKSQVDAGIVDAHIHFEQYAASDRAQILHDLQAHRIKAVVAVSMNLESSRRTLTLHREHPQAVLPAFGFHPEQPLPEDQDTNMLFDWIRRHQEEAVAIGEIGMPYYMRKEREAAGERFELVPYIRLLDRFLELAAELHKPVVLHAVYEDADTVCDLLERRGITKAHFHWFKGSARTIERMIANDYYVSFTPDIRYEEEIRKLASVYPLDRIMVETDGPWPFEGPYEGQMTHPRMTADVLKEIAAIKGVTYEAVEQSILNNTCAFYGIRDKG